MFPSPPIPKLRNKPFSLNRLQNEKLHLIDLRVANIVPSTFNLMKSLHTLHCCDAFITRFAQWRPIRMMNYYIRDSLVYVVNCFWRLGVPFSSLNNFQRHCCLYKNQHCNENVGKWHWFRFQFSNVLPILSLNLTSEKSCINISSDHSTNEFDQTVKISWTFRVQTKPSY